MIRNIKVELCLRDRNFNDDSWGFSLALLGFSEAIA